MVIDVSGPLREFGFGLLDEASQTMEEQNMSELRHVDSGLLQGNPKQLGVVVQDAPVGGSATARATATPALSPLRGASQRRDAGVWGS